MNTNPASNYGDGLGLSAVAGPLIVSVLAVTIVAFAYWKTNLSLPWMGRDGRRSTSKLVFFTWLLIVVAGASALLFHVALYKRDTLETVGLAEFKEEYLILMGIPVGVGVVSKALIEVRSRSGQVQKAPPPPPPAPPAPAEPPPVGRHPGGFILSDDGEFDLNDFQYVAFSALLMMYVTTCIVAKAELPDLPDTLVGLTGLSAIGFVATKATVGNPPIIHSASNGDGATADPAAPAGPELHILGSNLLKPDDNALDNTVQIEGIGNRKPRYWAADGTTVLVPVPAAVSSGRLVTVQCASGTVAQYRLP